VTIHNLEDGVAGNNRIF